MNLNRAFILGNLTRDPETKSTTTGQNVCRFAVATNRIWIDKAGAKQQKAEFHNIVAWGKLGDICSQYLKKGGLVFIEGRIETRNWTTPEGIKKYWTEIIAEKMQMGPRGIVGDGINQSRGSSNYNQPHNDQEEIPSIDTSAMDNEIEIKDIPF
ncbi:single-stranded DNA-binding protein [Candidatus Azambacteria bacterium]|nr:single-stranded DNA-binding protein [Candidatus Azambacteria bacterium]